MVKPSDGYAATAGKLPRLAATVILYHPEADVIENINSYAAGVEKVFVFDNTEAETRFAAELRKSSKIAYFHDGSNQGIAKRLNQACKAALSEGFEWLLTMDQDSKFEQDVFSRYTSCFYQYADKDQIAFFCTEFDRNPQLSFDCQVVEAENAITSGSLIQLSLIQKIGYFDENLFIDLVDIDYFIRCRLAGFRIIQFTNIVLCHRLGYQVRRSSIKTAYLIKKTKTLHSPLRCYYIYRNMLYLNKKFKYADDALAKRIKRMVISTLKNNLFYGRNVRAIIKELLKARSDYTKGYMGKRATVD